MKSKSKTETAAPMTPDLFRACRERLRMTYEGLSVALGYAPGHNGHAAREKEAGRLKIQPADRDGILRLLTERKLPVPRKPAAPARMPRPRGVGANIPLPPTMPDNATLLALYDAGVSGPKLAAAYGVTRQAISLRLASARAKRSTGPQAHEVTP